MYAESPDKINGLSAGGAPAVGRALSILRLLGKSEKPLGLTAIANQLGVVPSSCLRLIRVLVAEELVRCDPVTKQYSLDAGILTLARSVLRATNLARLAQPALDNLSRSFQLTAIAVQVVSLDHIVVVAVSESQLPLRLHVEIGSRFPALISATGRCLAAFSPYSWPEIEQKFRKVRWDSAPNFETWRSEVEAARRKRYSVDEGSFLSGVTAIASPVLDAAGNMTHAIVVLGLNVQIMQTGIHSMAEELRRIAESFSVNADPRASPNANTTKVAEADFKG